MMAIDLSWSGSPKLPNIIAPRHRGLTWIPVRPRLRYFMEADPTPPLGLLMTGVGGTLARPDTNGGNGGATVNHEQAERMSSGKGFIAALDQSGGSTPKA